MFTIFDLETNERFCTTDWEDLDQDTAEMKSALLDLIEHFNIEADLLAAESDLTLDDLIEETIFWALIKLAWQAKIRNLT